MLAAESEETHAAPSAASGSFRAQLLETEPSRRQEVFERYLVTQLAQVLRLPVSRVDPARPMGQLGLESLMALEFRNRLEASLGVKLSATVVWNHPTIQALARHLASRMEIAFESAPAVERREDAAMAVAPVGVSVDELSEEEALRALTGAADPNLR
jgi:myxalamid-type polyketide synthase MxaE and MxaD